MRLRRRRLRFSERTVGLGATHFGALAGSILVCLLWLRPAGAAFEFSTERWDSMSEFLALAREQLGRDRVVLAAQLNWEQLTPKDAVLVIHPETRVEFAEASAFLSAGGRLAILDDFGKADQLLARFHIQRTIAPSEPDEYLRNNRKLQVARPQISQGPGGASLRHPIVRDVEKVVTNHPTALRTDPSVELTPVLTLSSAEGETSLFALIGVIGDANACGLTHGTPQNSRARCGRLFAMADPSVFINLMLTFEGNRKLAKGLIEYLLEDDNWGARKGKLFIVVNDFHQAGHFGGHTDFQRQLESALDDTQQLLDKARSDGLPAKLSLALAALATLGASAWAFRSSGRIYRRPIPRYAKRTPVVAQGGAAGRAAVLSAGTTHHALVVLELKSATEELFRHALSLPAQASASAIIEAVEQQGALSPRSTKVLQRLFSQMARAESAVVRAQSVRLTAESVKDMRAELQTVLEELPHNKHGDRE